MGNLKVKVCGNSRAEDVRAADSLGADMIGVVIKVATSKRSVSGEVARELLGQIKNAERAALVLDPPADRLRELVDLINPDIVHFTGNEDPSVLKNLGEYFAGRIFKSIHLPPAEEGSVPVSNAIDMIKAYEDAGADTVVIDTRDASRGLYGGTGKVSDWKAAAEIVAASPLPVLLAGGIKLDNVEKAVREVKPYGLDLASGLERCVGEKDHELIKAFIGKVRELGTEE